jgi:acyl carrier protein
MALIDLVHRIEQVLGLRLDLETLDLEDWRSIRRITALLTRLEGGERRE